MTDIPVSMNRNFNGKLQSRFNINDYYLISGSGFGSKSAPAVYYDDFESRSLGGTGASVGSLVVSNSGGVTISNSSPRYTGAKHLQNNYATERFPKIYLPLATRSNVVKFSSWFKFSGTVTGGSNVWKFLRFNNTSGSNPYADYNKFSHEFTSATGVAYPTSASTTIGVDGGNSSDSSNLSPSDAPVTSLLVNGQWVFYQAEISAGTVDNMDANITVRINGKRHIRFVNRNYRSTLNPLDVGFILTPINGLDNMTTTTVVMAMDCATADISLAECIMTDNAVYDSSTNWEPQPIQYMEDTKCYVVRKRGTFTSGATAYYHIWNTSGAYVAAYTGLVV